MNPIFPLPDSLHTVLETLNRIYRTVLMLPPQASTMATRIDVLQYVEVSIYTAMCILYYAFAAYFLVRYRLRPGRDHGPLIHAPVLVGAYSVGMLGLFLAFWLAGHFQYRDIRTPPAGAVDVYVTAKEWIWKFAYTDGGSSVGVLYVPVGQPVRLLLTSRDVIHSFFVPAFRLKQDAVPGTYNTMWFEATQPGMYEILCAQMCGTGHARMWGVVAALGRADYDEWRRGEPPVLPAWVVGAGARDLPGISREPVTDANLAGAATPGTSPLLSAVELGRRAAATNGCLRCHTPDGQPHIGPTWLGLYGSSVALAGGATATVDEAYLTESMMDPTAKVVAGFAPVMPSYQGILAPADVAAILEYIKSLRDPGRPHHVAPPPAGPIPGVPASPGAAQAPAGKGGRP